MAEQEKVSELHVTDRVYYKTEHQRRVGTVVEFGICDTVRILKQTRTHWMRRGELTKVSDVQTREENQTGAVGVDERRIEAGSSISSKFTLDPLPTEELLATPETGQPDQQEPREGTPRIQRTRQSVEGREAVRVRVDDGERNLDLSVEATPVHRQPPPEGPGEVSDGRTLLAPSVSDSSRVDRSEPDGSVHAGASTPPREVACPHCHKWFQL